MKAQETYRNTDDYRGVLADRFLEARKLTHDNLELAQQRPKEQYDKTAKEKSYEIRQQMWLYTPNNKKGLSHKLTHNWHGPYRILAKKTPVNYLLDANHERNYIQIVHINRLKPFISATNKPILAPTVENHEKEHEVSEEQNETDPAELTVKSMLDKKVVKNRSVRRETFYLIQWEDQNIEPSWEPLSSHNCGKLLKDFEWSLQNKKNC